jgi:hypothetical protein
MRQVDPAFHHQRAVEMLDRTGLLALPLFHELSRLFVVLGDGLVIDGVEVLGIDTHALVRLGNVEFADLLENRLRVRSGDDRKNEQCGKQDN